MVIFLKRKLQNLSKLIFVKHGSDTNSLMVFGSFLLLAVGLSGSYMFLSTQLKSRASDLSGDSLQNLVSEANMAMEALKKIKLNLASAAPPTSPTPSNPAKAKASKTTQTTGSSSNSGHFYTLPVGAALPSDATCASLVRTVAETRPANAASNGSKGSGGNVEFPRVSGNFTGTTDEILQWVACKWGIDEDIVRAQATKESWWFHRTMGDFTTNSAVCAPNHQTLGADGVPGQCPESVGLLQVRWQYHQSAFVNNSALNSTAYNADYTYAVWRDCFEGNMTWLNDVEKGGVYAAGDVWGCVGEWFSGRWLTPTTLPYIDAVKNYLNQRMWEHPDFLSAS